MKNDIKLYLRCALLWTVEWFNRITSRCTKCGRLGASPCSVANLKVLCERCSSFECRKFDVRCSCCGGIVIEPKTSLLVPGTYHQSCLIAILMARADMAERIAQC